MATVSKVANLKRQVIIKHGKYEMAVAIFREQPTIPHRDSYWKASDELDDKLNEYYAASIMFLQLHKPDLYEVFINLSKQEVMDRMINRIVKRQNMTISSQLVNNRIDRLEETIKTLKTARKPIPNKLIRELSHLKEQTR